MVMMIIIMPLCQATNIVPSFVSWVIISHLQNLRETQEN